jgi:hypothetical protein
MALTANVTVNWLAFFPRIREVPHFIHCLEMAILIEIFRGFPQNLHAIAGMIF